MTLHVLYDALGKQINIVRLESRFNLGDKISIGGYHWKVIECCFEVHCATWHIKVIPYDKQ